MENDPVKRKMERPLLSRKLIILEEDGTLRVAEADPQAYREISNGRLYEKKAPAKFWVPPVYYKGLLYCRNLAGDLFCVDLRRGN